MQVNNISEKSCMEKTTLQDLARKKLPCKILQVIAFLQGSCKILARNAFFLNQGIEVSIKSWFVWLSKSKIAANTGIVNRKW